MTRIIHFATVTTADGIGQLMLVDLDLGPDGMQEPAATNEFGEVIWDLESAFVACSLMVRFGLWENLDAPRDPIPHQFVSKSTRDELMALIDTATAIEGDRTIGELD